MNPGQVDFDNLPIKGYADPIDDEEDGSTPEESSPTTAATIMIPTPAQVQQPDLQC
ncbi:MAG: hypothetical protein IKP95_07875 [Ruminococcus sp.]|nr:hypothetical protein [Ruminococcus sp.]